MGRMAVKLEMETLEVARLHDQAVASLLPQEADTGEREALTAKAAMFFSEAINPIEQTHPAVREVQADIQEKHLTLAQRTTDLENLNWRLKVQTRERKAFAALHQQKDQASRQLMIDSKLLEKKLQSMARDILSANEVERKR